MVGNIVDSDFVYIDPLTGTVCARLVIGSPDSLLVRARAISSLIHDELIHNELIHNPQFIIQAAGTQGIGRRGDTGRQRS